MGVLYHALVVARNATLGLLCASPTACQLFEPKRSALEPLWHTVSTFPGSSWTGRPALDGGRLFVEDGNTVLALDASTGAKLWARPVRHVPEPPPTTLLARDGRVYISEVDSVLAMDEQDGHTIWNFHPDSQAIVVPAMDQNTYYTGQRGIPVVYALALADGTLRWRTDLSAGRGYQYAAHVVGLTVSGDTLYVNARHNLAANGYLSTGLLVALDRSDGHELWRYETTGPYQGFRDEPIVSGGYLVINDFLGKSVVAYDVAAQREAWRVTSPDNGPERTIVSGGTAYVADGDGTAFAVDVRTGSVKWKKDVGTSPLGAGFCAEHFFVTNDRVARLDAATGTLMGRFDPARDAAINSSGASDGQRVYVTGADGIWAFPC